MANKHVDGGHDAGDEWVVWCKKIVEHERYPPTVMTAIAVSTLIIMADPKHLDHPLSIVDLFLSFFFLCEVVVQAVAKGPKKSQFGQAKMTTEETERYNQLYQDFYKDMYD